MTEGISLPRFNKNISPFDPHICQIAKKKKKSLHILFPNHIYKN